MLTLGRSLRAASTLLAVVLLFLLLAGTFTLGACRTQDPQWSLFRPSNTGIPGVEIRCLGFAPDSRIWIGARWPFAAEGGVGVYDRVTDLWTTYANFTSPIPSEFVNDIAFGPGGVVWMATDRGLVRKQGDTWTVYTTANSPLLHNVIRDVEVDSQGRVWANNSSVQHEHAALFEFDGTTWRSFAVPTELPWPDPWWRLDGLLVDRQDHVWVGNEALAGVAEYNGQSWTLRGESLDVHTPQAADQSNGIWMITGGLGYEVYRWNGSSFVLFGGGTPPLYHTSITEVSVSPSGAVFIGNGMGQVVQSLDLGLHWSTFQSVSAAVWSIAHDQAGTEVWIGATDAVLRYSSAGELLHVYNTFNTGVPDWSIDRFNVDPAGNTWLASGHGGLSRFDGQRWRNWGNHNAGSEPYPFAGNEPMGCYHQDIAGTGWMGGNGIARWDPGTGQFTGFWNWQNNPGMPPGLWIYFAEDAAGHLFSAEQYGSIYRFDPGTQRWNPEPVLPYAVVGLPGMEADRHGNVWIAGWFDIYKWDGTTWSTIALPYPNYFFDLGGINCMAIGPNDVFWFGTLEGVVRWDGSTFRRFDTTNSPLTNPCVTGVDVDAHGRVALAASNDQTTTSVAIIDGDPAVPTNWTVYRYGQAPLASWMLGPVKFDARGDLWISCWTMGAVVLRIGSDPTPVPDPEHRVPTVGFAVGPAAPNPFRSSTTIRYALPREGQVHLEVFDIQGRLVRTLVSEDQAPGSHSATWQGTDEAGRPAPSGVYFGRVRTQGYDRTVRLVLIR